MDTRDKLTVQYLKRKAIRDCLNLVGRQAFYYSRFEMRKLVKLWADRIDCTLELPFGTYEGIGGIKRRFITDMGDRNDPETAKYMEGTMMFIGCSSDNFQVADDLKTARASFLSPGIEAYGPNIKLKDYRNTAMWRYAKYGIDFICEDGEWKIWHMHVFQVFETPWDTCWTKGEPYAGYPIRDTHIDREPLRPIYQWQMTAVYPHDEPLPPTEYKSFDEVEPGYGYFA